VSEAAPDPCAVPVFRRIVVGVDGREASGHAVAPVRSPSLPAAMPPATGSCARSAWAATTAPSRSAPWRWPAGWRTKQACPVLVLPRGVRAPAALDPAVAQ
jgi:hypothetical protein